MEEVVERFWHVFQPLLFGLIGAEIVISTLEVTTVCECCFSNRADWETLERAFHT